MIAFISQTVWDKWRTQRGVFTEVRDCVIVYSVIMIMNGHEMRCLLTFTSVVKSSGHFKERLDLTFGR